MKKKLLVLTVLVMALSVCLAFAGIAGAAATVEGQAEYFMGEYANMFEDRRIDLGDAYVDYLQQNKNAVIVYGTVSGETDGYEYGIVIYPEGSTYESADAKFYKANSAQDGKFGVAISLSGNFVNSGKYSARAYVIQEGLPLVASNVVPSTNGATFTTTTEQYSAPTNVTRVESGTISWDAVDGASYYRVQLQREKVAGTYDDSVYPYVTVATTTDTTYDVSDYLKTLTKEELNSMHNCAIRVRVAADGEDKARSAWASIDGEENILGEVDGANYRIATVDSQEDLATYATSSSYFYVVLADDIAIEGNIARSGASYSITGKSLTEVFDGLGHKISYSYNEIGVAVTPGQNYHGIFTGISSGNLIKNVHLDAELSIAKSTDDYHYSAFSGGASGGCTIKNSYFKVRATAYNVGSNRTRTRLVGGTATFDNCIFDMVTYGKSGVIAGGSDKYDQIVANTVTVNNCAYITNGASTTKPWTRNGGSEQTVNNSAMYASFDAFATAYAGFDDAIKANYENAGFVVDADSVDYNGVAVAELGVTKCATPENLAFDNYDTFTWDPVSGAESYNVRVYVNYALMDTVATTAEEFDFSAWLRTLDSNTLKSLDDSVVAISVNATGSEYADGDFTNPVSVSWTNSSDTVRDVKVQAVSTATELKESIGEDAYVVFTQDINCDATEAKSLIGKATVGAVSLLGDYLSGTVDGLGHKFTYVIEPNTYDIDGATGTDDDVIDAEQFALFGYTSFNARLFNISIIADITRAFSTDTSWTCALSYRTNGKGGLMRNVLFDTRLTTTAETDSFKPYTRLVAIQQVDPNANTTFENCIFNLRSYKSDGTLREYSSGCEGTTVWTGTSGTYTTLKNCVFVKNTTKAKPVYGVNEGTVSYDFLEDFTTAWADESFENKDIFEKAGWSVDGTTIKLHGNAISR